MQAWIDRRNRKRLLGRGAPLANRLDRPRHAGDGRRFPEKRLDRQLHTEQRLDVRNHLRAVQGIAAQQKEIVVATHATDLQKGRPKAG